METMVRGSRKPDLKITCADAADEADWNLVTTGDVRVVGWQNDVPVFDSAPNQITVAPDGNSIVIRRVWGVSDTAVIGRMWVQVVVTWGTGFTQVFPADGPLRIDIVPGAAGT